MKFVLASILLLLPMTSFAQGILRPAIIGEPHMRINGGDFETTTQKVLLTFDVPGATEMSIANSLEGEGAWVPYQGRLLWELAPGEGQKFVFAAFRNELSVSEVISESIYYKPALSGKGALGFFGLFNLLLVGAGLGWYLQKRKRFGKVPEYGL